jgi:Tfp pilus assembly protein PilV
VRAQAGFTLLEALVALGLVLTFAAVLGPTLFHARRIMEHSGTRIAAHVVLRTLLDAPFDRSKLENIAREGEVAGLRWRIVSEPIGSVAPAADAASEGAAPRRSKWSAFRVIASVSWGDGQIITAETMRLGTMQ